MGKRYRVAVIGTGFAEQVQIPGFQRHPRFEVVALAARDPQRTERVARAAAIPRWSSDWRALLREGGFDLVSVTPPPATHHEMVLAALDGGYHLLCEKPFALNVAQAEAMVRRAEATGRTAMVDHEFRYLAGRQRFGALVREGFVGELRRVVVSYHQGWRADPQRAWNWWSDAAQGGGLLGAIGSHYFDALRHWFAVEPTRVWGRLQIHLHERPAQPEAASRPVTADEAFVALLDLGNGAEALFDFSATANPGTGSRVTAYGSAGTLELVDERRLRGARAGGEWAEIPFEEWPRDADEAWLIAPFHRLLDDLVRGIEQGDSPSPNFADALAHQRFLDAVRASDRSGGWEPLSRV